MLNAAALHVYRGATFPDFSIGETRATEYQAGLLGDADDGPATKLTLQGLSDHPDFERYLCEHQEIRSVDAVWRRNDITSLTMKYRFHVFRHKAQRELVLARGSQRIVRAAIRRLNGTKVFDFKVDPVDIKTLTKELRARRATVHAAYFAQLALRKVNSATLYGEDVDQSEEYGHLDQAGVLSAVNIETALDGVPERFLVTQRRTVVVLRRQGERPQLSLAQKVNALIEEVLPRGTGPQSA